MKRIERNKAPRPSSLDSSPALLNPFPSLKWVQAPPSLHSSLFHRRPRSPGCTPTAWFRCHFTHLCLDHRPLPLGSYKEYRCQKVLVWLNLFCSQKHIPGRTVPCTQQDIHIVQPRVLGLPRWGGLRSRSRCRGTQYLQEKQQVGSNKW